MGYSWPNSDFTFFSASSMRLRFSGLEKSMNGSSVNSEMCSFCSAVATVESSSISDKSLDCEKPLYRPCKRSHKQMPCLRFCSRFKRWGNKSFKVELNLEGDVRGDGLAVLRRRLVSVILHRFQSWPAQRRWAGQHGGRSYVPIRVDNSVDYYASGLEVPQILQGSNGSPRLNQFRGHDVPYRICNWSHHFRWQRMNRRWPCRYGSRVLVVSRRRLLDDLIGRRTGSHFIRGRDLRGTCSRSGSFSRERLVDSRVGLGGLSC